MGQRVGGIAGTYLAIAAPLRFANLRFANFGHGSERTWHAG